jgi:uncharacterized membrane protein YdjX (TVP38/TMEM64 family)
MSLNEKDSERNSDINAKSEDQPGLISRIKESLNFKKMSRGKAIYTLVFLAIIAIMVFLYVYTYLIDNTLLTRIIVLLFVIPVTSIGGWGVLLYFGIMALQCIVAPIPSELVQVVGGLIFGVTWGSILSLIGIMITSFIGYNIAIKGGAHVVAAAIGPHNVNLLEKFITKYGIWAMIIGRGIPIVPFDLMTYGAGLVNMKKRDFIIGTLVGAIPRSIFYAWIGSILFPGGVSEIITAFESGTLDFEAMLESVSGNFNLILTLTILIIGGGFILFQVVILPLMRKKANKELKQNVNN